MFEACYEGRRRLTRFRVCRSSAGLSKLKASQVVLFVAQSQVKDSTLPAPPPEPTDV